MPRKAPSTPPKRLRASKPKVTTGCLTCKIRHVKCDESKPHCRRCLSTGRTCDGYSPPRPPPHTIPHPNLPITNTPSTLSFLPSLPGTPTERLSFHTFHTHTAPHLRGLFASPFWSQHVLQASLREEVIWHAAVALGALHGSFYQDARMGGGKGEGEGLAVRQYVKAISCLTRPDGGGERRVDVALMACVLFTCFESLRGHHFPALIHLDNGINLLLELHSPPPSSSPAPPYPKTPYTPLPAMHTLLTRLDTQATQLLPSRRTRLCPSSAPRSSYLFTSLEDAQSASDELWNYSLYTLQPSPPSSPRPAHHPQQQQQKLHPSLPPSTAHQHLVRLQAEYTTTLTTFLATHPARTPQEQQAGSTLRLHALVASLSLSPASLSPSEGVWSSHTADFAAIVALAKAVMEADDGAVAGGVGRVGLDTGVLGPLYLVALRCRDGVVRREALLLLEVAGRREGLWDSSLLARVAERVVGMEEGGCGVYVGGAGGRVADVEVVFDPEGCRAGMRVLLEGGGSRVT